MTYESLQAVFRLRPIRTEVDYNSAMALWDDYIAGPGGAFDSTQTLEAVIQYAEVLSILMAEYEAETLALEMEDEDGEDDA